MPSQLIINADDFGAANCINAAVKRAHIEGVLTSASLMVTGDAAHEAVSIARNNPGLAVGLHLALSCAKSAIQPQYIPSLVDIYANFPSNPARAALKYYFSRKARRQLKQEIEAQFALFERTGLPLSHVDGHQHMHAHPAVLPTVIERAKSLGAKGIRIPRDPVRSNLEVDVSRIVYKLIAAVSDAYLTRVCNCLLPASGLASCDYSIGSLMSGDMSDTYAMLMLGCTSAPCIEVYFHPADIPEGDPPLDPFGPNRGDMLALLSPAFKQFISERGYELANYSGLRKPEAADERC